MSRAPRKLRAMPQQRGAFDIQVSGVQRFDLRDPYHFALSITWLQFFGLFVLAEICLNAIFAVLYWIEPGSVANTRSGSFLDHFFFSLETLATVGYGVMAPATTYGHVISAIEIVTGVAFTAIVTGLVFGRFSRPKAKIIYANSAIGGMQDGRPALMVRIGNGRTTLLVDAEARLTALIAGVTAEGSFFRRPHDLKLLRKHFPVFALTWTLIHYLDEGSPLHGLDAERAREIDLRLYISLKARDIALAADIHDMRAYRRDDLLFNVHYVDAVAWDGQGHTTADMTLISDTEPD